MNKRTIYAQLGQHETPSFSKSDLQLPYKYCFEKKKLANYSIDRPDFIANGVPCCPFVFHVTSFDSKSQLMYLCRQYIFLFGESIELCVKLFYFKNQFQND